MHLHWKKYKNTDKYIIIIIHWLNEFKSFYSNLRLFKALICGMANADFEDPQKPCCYDKKQQKHMLHKCGIWTYLLRVDKDCIHFYTSFSGV